MADLPLSATRRQSLRPQERLKRRSHIRHLFERGEATLIRPFRLYYCVAPSSVSVHQVLFSAPKRHFPTAVARNRRRRLLTEAYRRNKHLLQPLTRAHVVLLIGYVYVERAQLSFAQLAHALCTSLDFLVKTHLRDASFSSSK